MLLRHCICANANALLVCVETMYAENIGNGFMVCCEISRSKAIAERSASFKERRTLTTQRIHYGGMSDVLIRDFEK